MAYTRTQWVNGETPINAQNLNKIENGIENAYEKSILTISVNGTQNISPNGLINFSIIYCQSGDTTKLTLDTSNKGIKIGAGVSKVLVSAIINSSCSSRKWFHLRKNNAKIFDCLTQETTPYGTSFFTPVLVNVSEGDYFNIYSSENSVTINGDITNVNGTLLTIEVVE